jgi:hypothetical protein
MATCSGLLDTFLREAADQGIPHLRSHNFLKAIAKMGGCRYARYLKYFF